MTDLLLQPSGNPTQYEVIADGQIVGRIALFSSLRDHSRPWVWSIDLAFYKRHDRAHGFEATREAASVPDRSMPCRYLRNSRSTSEV
jgi:hypothetical protein